LTANYASSKKMIHPLTSFRAFGAVFVMLYHYRNKFDLSLQDHIPALEFGYLGVDAFFILSGFIIFHTYGDQFSNTTSVSVRTFFVRMFNFLVARIARVYPVHLFVLVLYGLYVLGGLLLLKDPNLDPYSGKQFLAQIVLVHGWNFDNSTSFSWNPVSWSISAEWYAYLLFPFLIFLVFRLRAIAFHVAIIVGCISAAFLFVSTIESNQLQEHGILRMSLEFPLGASLCVIWHRVGDAKVPWDGIAVLSFLSFGTYLSVTAPLPQSPHIQTLGNQGLVLIFLALLIISLASSRGFVLRALSQRTMIVFGEISYSIYMVHYFIGVHILDYVHSKTGSAIPGLFGYFGAIGVTIIVSYMMYRWIEVPARRYIRGHFYIKT